MRMLHIFVVASSVLVELGYCGKFLLTLPQHPHYDTQYTATVSAFGVREPENVYLVYRGSKDASRILNSTKLTFKSDGVQKWTVMFPWRRMEEIQETGVELRMSTLLTEKKKKLYFSTASGYIFIQTDKPIYTPRQTVKFRIIAVDEHQRLAKYPVKVDIKNEKLIVIDRMRYSAEDAFKGQELELPKETPPGNWTISACFDGMNNADGYVHKVSFEVKEYVLPRFQAFLNISDDVITRETYWVSFTVKAKYVYGQNVLGSAEMQLGIWNPISGLDLLPEKYTGILENGEVKIYVNFDKVLNKTQILKENQRLYVNLNVTEDGTKENDTIIDTSTFIAHPYYDILYDNSKSHFKPGFPYTVHTQVKARSGRPASWMQLWVATEFKSKNGTVIKSFGAYHQMDDQGRNITEYDIPKDAHSISFKTSVLDFKVGFNNNNKLIVPVLESANQQYLHISMMAPVMKYRDGKINLQYTPARFVGVNSSIERITVQIIARGHIVYSTSIVRNTDGRSVLPIPRSIYTEVSPSMRIVASFYHVGKKGEEFVVDSLKVKTDDACVEELTLRRPGGIFASSQARKPKDKYKIQVRGGKSMTVGFVAVDKAVFILNDAHSLTRRSLFEQLGGHDQGNGIGDGKDWEGVLENSGLSHLFIDTELEKIEKNPLRMPLMAGHRFVSAMGKAILPDRFQTARTENAGPIVVSEAPPQTVRRYFPESWLFEEHTLSKRGRMELDLTLPDSITTWSFMAVGLSSDRGVCVSQFLEQQVQKSFFVDVRLPYKATRLEEIKVKAAIYNYHTEPISITVVVTGSEGICFSANRYRGSNQTGTSFKMTIGKGQTQSRDIKIIPLKNGDLTLRVDAFSSTDRDVVEKQIYVVAEGLRMKKSLTFVLDPEANHVPVRRAKMQLLKTATIKNTIDVRLKKQKTKVDLAMPREVIRGTETCKISAFGDLMGDVINRAVIKSKNLMDQMLQNAEEVLGDLGPTVHALIYANRSGIMNEALGNRSHRFVRHGVARLMRYRQDTAFGLTPKSPKATWLTAVVLKTLCHASKIAFVDKENLIDNGFDWILSRVDEDNTLYEEDWRLAKDSTEYQMMLAAEIMIASKECERTESENHEALMMQMYFLIIDNLEIIKEPMVLAKAAYALTLFDGENPDVDTKKAVKRLASIRRKNRNDQVYWSSESVTNDKRKVPFWYHKGAKASAIEATSYALLVFLKHPGINIDAVADWLVSQRNDHGIFISAMDSMVAIQALSRYSLLKQGLGLKLDLSCNVTSDKSKNYVHSFKFTEKNAISPESLNNVPVGHTLDISTIGQGLGQMQINVEYNIPIDPNEKCPYNVTVVVKETETNFYSDMIDDPLCIKCSWGCRPIPKPTTESNDTVEGNSTITDLDNRTLSFLDGIISNLTKTENLETTTAAPPPTPQPKEESGYDSPSLGRVVERKLGPSRRISMANPFEVGPLLGRSREGPPPSPERRRPSRKGHEKNPYNRSLKNGKGKSYRYRIAGHKNNRRKQRSVRQHSAASRKSICIKVCIQYVEEGGAGHTRIEVDMLTGFLPVASDVERLKDFTDVVDAWYVSERDSLVVVFKQVLSEEQSCIAFRAVDHQEVGRPTPATVLVTEVGNPVPSCALSYHSPSGKESLQVYCADFSNINRGECRCYSGICSECAPYRYSDKFEIGEAKELVCKSDIGYQVQVSKVEDRNQWVEIDATVLSLNKTGSHKLMPNETIKMMSPSSCPCPLSFARNNEPLYLISPDVEKMVDRFGNIVHNYLLDEQSFFLRVGDPDVNVSSSAPSVQHVFLKQAFRKCAP